MSRLNHIIIIVLVASGAAVSARRHRVKKVLSTATPTTDDDDGPSITQAVISNYSANSARLSSDIEDAIRGGSSIIEEPLEKVGVLPDGALAPAAALNKAEAVEGVAVHNRNFYFQIGGFEIWIPNFLFSLLLIIVCIIIIYCVNRRRNQQMQMRQQQVGVGNQQTQPTTNNTPTSTATIH